MEGEKHRRNERSIRATTEIRLKMCAANNGTPLNRYLRVKLELRAYRASLGLTCSNCALAPSVAVES